jgi:predicted HicB family RNase H-like nuclease
MPVTAEDTDKLSIYFPKRYQEQKPCQRLRKLAKKRDRSVNYLVIQALVQYLEQEEGKQRR